MFDKFLDKCRERMNDTIASLNKDIDSISTGRAKPSLLSPVKVEVYGSSMPIDQLSSISIADSSTINIQIWDNSNIKAVEKAIIDSNIGFSPVCEGSLIRINIPKLSQERRVELCKLAKKYGEDKKISLRNIRRDIIDIFKKDDELSSSKDNIHNFSELVQKITDEHCDKIDNIVNDKEKELMSV